MPCRTIESNPPSFRVSWEDRSPFVKVTKDGLRLAGEKGFRSARCNAPVREGKWYMEVKIKHGGGEHMPDTNRSEGSHVRLGWGRREAPINGPAGLDGYSYAMRDKTGEKVTLSRPRPYGRPFGSGDVIGMYISLPSRRQASKKDLNDPAHIKRERIPIDFKGQEYFESLEYPQSKEMIALMDYSGKSSNTASVPSTVKKSATVKNPSDRGRTAPAPVPEVAPLRPLPTLPDSYIAFFVNGECQGIAFENIYDYLQLRTTELSRKGKERKRNHEGARQHKENIFDDGTLGYYPLISLFNNACVQIHPGPDFEFTPPPDIDAVLGIGQETDAQERTWRPMSERYPEFMAEQWALDAEEEEEARVAFARRATTEKTEADKKTQRNKRRQQAEARKRAKKAVEVASMLDDDRFGPSASLALLPEPSPLRHGMAYVPDLDASPAPTVASSIDLHVGPSENGYDSETGEGNGDEQMEVDKEGSMGQHESPQLHQDIWANPFISEERSLPP